MKRAKPMLCPRGNALFIVLIGIALFGALSLAVLESAAPSKGPDQEKARLLAVEIVDYASSLTRAVRQMKYAAECGASDINFDNAVVSGYDNEDAPADGRCDVFAPNGGGMALQTPPGGANDGSDWLFTGDVQMPDVGTTDGAPVLETESATTELAAILPNVTEGTCLQINRILNVDAVGGAPPQGIASLGLPAKFTGTYTVNAVLGSVGGAHLAALQGKNKYCFRVGATGTYHFIAALWPR